MKIRDTVSSRLKDTIKEGLKVTVWSSMTAEDEAMQNAKELFEYGKAVLKGLEKPSVSDKILKFFVSQSEWDELKKKSKEVNASGTGSLKCVLCQLRMSMEGKKICLRCRDEITADMDPHANIEKLHAYECTTGSR